MTYTDEKGYLRDKYGKLVHRQIAYEIYKSNRHKYPLAFSQYVVHHIDEDKQNNDSSNLQIMNQKEHEKIHGIENKSLQSSDVELITEKDRNEILMVVLKLAGLTYLVYFIIKIFI